MLGLLRHGSVFRSTSLVLIQSPVLDIAFCSLHRRIRSRPGCSLVTEAGWRIYLAHKVEFLALKWAITDTFHDYFYGNTFEVLTDSIPLTYGLTSTKLDATQQRWTADLANYIFTIKYKTGKTNCDTDGLSRFVYPEDV